MLEELEDDTHLCIKCSQTIVGLENYVRHRKNHCNKSLVTTSLNREIIGTNHSYQSFEFAEPSSGKHDKPFNFNFNEMGSVHHDDHDDSHDGVSNTSHILPSPLHQGEKASDYKTDPNKSLSESYDYNYGLGADMFFSLLNLQSSSKSKAQTSSNVPTDNVSNSMIKNDGDKMMERKADASDSTHNEHLDDWIESGTGSGTDKLMKAVNEISGTKKMAFDSPQYSYEYTHDHGSPEAHATEFDEDEIEDNENEQDNEHDHEPDNEHEHENENDLVEEDEDMTVPPHTHTGGKWRPSERSHHTSTTRWYERWDISDNQLPIGSNAVSNEELVDNVDEYNPPPSHTKGKWVPGTKIIRLDYKHKDRHDSESFSEQFWCRSCNRKLSSRIVYERHLKSKLHIKRSQPENDLELAALPLPCLEEVISEQVVDCGTSISDTSQARNRRRKGEIAFMHEHGDDLKKKRKRRFNYIKCNICKSRVRTVLYGKHLISHYHYRRMFKNPTEFYKTILENIGRIVLQSPYQCHPCRFYANTEDLFLRHWDSDDHNLKCREPGSFWCSFCKFVCQTNDEMRKHLTGKTHEEVILAINRSVPIIIRRRKLIQCEKCQKEFSYNIGLRQHATVCSGSRPLGTASDQYQSKHYCADCGEYFSSLIVYQRHMTSVHCVKSYFCGPCELSFSRLEEAKRHRVSAEHKIKAARMKSKTTLQRKCIVCGEIQEDLLLLKEHLKSVHPDHNYPCYLCGRKFILPQELSRHIRDKVCKCDEVKITDTHNIDHSDALASTSLLELPIISDISHESGISELIVASQSEPKPSTSAMSAENAKETYMIIETENETKSQSIDSNDDQLIDGIPVLWACRQCDFRTPTQAECIFHEMLHKWNVGNDNKIPCPICDRTFNKNSLRCHLRLHTNERIFECEQCELKFTRKTNLREHIHRIHIKGSTKRKPKPPKKQSKRASTSKEPSDQLFSCSVCEKNFRKKGLLDQHMHCHREIISIKVFECPEADCLFIGRSAAELRVHQTTHSLEKNYHCPVESCDFKTKTKALLNRHKKSQHQENTENLLHCSQCSFTTKISSHLKRHNRIHTGEKPYQCPHCSYVSNNPENLRKHVINTNKHPGRFLYECDMCLESGITQFVTNNSKQYKSHLVSVHNEKK